jgi:chromosome segregation ATPase
MAQHQDQLEDVLDARAEIRELRRKVTMAKAAWTEAKTELSAATQRVEDLLTEIETRQGRLPFPFPDAEPKPKGKPRQAG